LRDLKSRPAEITSWNESWFEAHSLFVYETFLYMIAALLKTNAFKILHEVFTSHYLLPDTERNGDMRFDTFDGFYAHSEILQHEFASEGRRLLSPAAELIKRQADREDLPFSALMEADLLILLMAFINPNVGRWYPQTLHYSSYGSGFPFFIRATQHKHFLKLATITGISDADQLRNKVREGHKRLRVSQWHNFSLTDSIWSKLNMDKIDSLK
jgi:hypothetical protein